MKQLIRILFLGFFICLILLSNDVAIAGKWTWVNSFPHGHVLRDVWGSSSNDVFAVGFDGQIIYYDGAHWSYMNSTTNDDFVAVGGTSGSNVFATTWEGTIYHYDGNDEGLWTKMDFRASVRDIWADSGNVVYGVGGRGTIIRYSEPTIIEITDFNSIPESNKTILQWTTTSEVDNAGFNLYRAEAEDGEYIQINDSLISAKGFPTQSASYEFIDEDVQNRKTYYYKLEDININGISTFHGPVKAVPRNVYGGIK